MKKKIIIWVKHYNVIETGENVYGLPPSEHSSVAGREAVPLELSYVVIKLEFELYRFNYELDECDNDPSLEDFLSSWKSRTYKVFTQAGNLCLLHHNILNMEIHDIK